MTNFELMQQQYPEVMMEVMSGKDRLAVNFDGEPCCCGGCDCSSRCTLNQIGESCEKARRAWLNEQVSPEVNWRDVPIDTPVDILGMRAHYAGIVNGFTAYWAFGRTSWTGTDTDKKVSSIMKLVREEDIEKYSSSPKGGLIPCHDEW